ncbi:MAG TPA: encapsulin, partial [Terriglobia bacterium]|nr:encapsulin [Terriglobia bacterium]
MPNSPQVPWTDEQWARVNQVVQEEAKRARVAAQFLPLYGPLAPDTDFVRREFIPREDEDPRPLKVLKIGDRSTIQLATLAVKVQFRGAQMADPDLNSVLTLFRRAANIIARLEDAVIFRGLVNGHWDQFEPPGGVPKGNWEIHGGQKTVGLWVEEAGANSPTDSSGGLETEELRAQKRRVRVPVALPDGPDPPGDVLVGSVSEAIGKVEEAFHLGPFALVLGQRFFRAAQTPSPSLVLPQDRILPFLNGGPLLRSSTLPEDSGVLVALGGAPVELVVAQDLAIQFLQVTE